LTEPHGKESLVIPEDSVAIGIEHNMKASENIISDTDVINSMVLSSRCRIGIRITSEKTGDDGMSS
jgi:hypothetical protein